MNKENTEGVYRFADCNFHIKSVYSDVQVFCRDYRTDGEPEICVEVTPEDIAYERMRSEMNAKAEGRPVIDYKEPYLEKLAVYRKIAEAMPTRDTVLLHGSVIAVEGEAYIFTAKSGTGKSTHTRLWREMLGERAVMVNDDKPLIHVGPDRVTVYGTPWDGKHHLSTNIAVPVRAICVLERAEENRICPITKEDALTLMIKQTYRPSEAVAMVRTLQLVGRLCDNVKLYRMGCNISLAAAELSYETMSRG